MPQKTFRLDRGTRIIRRYGRLEARIEPSQYCGCRTTLLAYEAILALGMPESLREMERQDLGCENLLECFHGMGDLEIRVFTTLVESDEPLTIDQIAERVDRERSTAYRAARRLREAGFAKRSQINYDHGGYYHVFEPVDSGEIATEMQRMLNEWYATMGQLIGEFREKFETSNVRVAES